jgi:hypothetical protein
MGKLFPIMGVIGTAMISPDARFTVVGNATTRLL